GPHGTTLPSHCDSHVASKWMNKKGICACSPSLLCDDCVSIGEGSYNIDIKNVTCGPSHGNVILQQRLGIGKGLQMAPEEAFTEILQVSLCAVGSVTPFALVNESARRFKGEVLIIVISAIDGDCYHLESEAAKTLLISNGSDKPMISVEPCPSHKA
ncbi:prolyl-tRNA synthetase associated domain-containing protein 1, partial [Tanacetum coccineum]